jgi:outer membrane protein OmpA-like peptidoglycan-associated protein
MKVTAKCTNFSGCLVAYRGEKIEVADGAPLVCPECGKPLTVVKPGQAALIKIAAIVVVVAVLAGGAFFAVKKIAQRNKAPQEETTQPAETPPGTLSSTTSDAGDTTPPPPSVGPDPTTGIAPVVPDAPPPPPAKADNTPVSDTVRDEVLKRIDAMPNIAPEKKDKLYNSVRRAKEMRRVVVVSFGSAQGGVPAPEKDNVKNLLSSAEVMKFRDDLTAVFVVLGFADGKGTEKGNLAISGARAKAVKNFMTNVCGVKNVTHDVAMGGSNLVDDKDPAKNRVVEIWAVVPG